MALHNKTQIPKTVAKYFWGDDLTEIDTEQHKKYIASIILEKGDEDSVHWLINFYGKDKIVTSLPDLKLSPKSAHFWNFYLS